MLPPDKAAMIEFKRVNRMSDEDIRAEGYDLQAVGHRDFSVLSAVAKKLMPADMPYRIREDENGKVGIVLT